MAMTTKRPSVYETGLSCPHCRRHYSTAKPIRFLLRFGLCLRCWHTADPDQRYAADPFKTESNAAKSAAKRAEPEYSGFDDEDERNEL